MFPPVPTFNEELMKQFWSSELATNLIPVGGFGRIVAFKMVVAELPRDVQMEFQYSCYHRSNAEIASAAYPNVQSTSDGRGKLRSEDEEYQRRIDAVIDHYRSNAEIASAAYPNAQSTSDGRGKLRSVDEEYQRRIDAVIDQLAEVHLRGKLDCNILVDEEYQRRVDAVIDLLGQATV
ncbi:hypothetical protein CDAR_218921 [Caerostris darwini]|uniref:Uncharacterized protein n=1 Tax=Caerostris darwini TaxID=1538125 RepID=A0AAV4VP36_9ARAC|nr:hypothetical protein CDAR_218921 [Caerostris darwini]